MDSYDEAQAAYYQFCVAEARERRVHVPWYLLPTQDKIKWVQHVMRSPRAFTQDPRAGADVRDELQVADPAKHSENADCHCGEHAYQFTRTQLIDALARLEVKVPVTGPLAGKVLADSFADALIAALDDAVPEYAPVTNEQFEQFTKKHNVKWQSEGPQLRGTHLSLLGWLPPPVVGRVIVPWAIPVAVGYVLKLRMEAECCGLVGCVAQIELKQSDVLKCLGHALGVLLLWPAHYQTAFML